MQVATVSVYTRVSFNITEDPQDLLDVFLGADFDDGIVAWINGLEVYRSPGMPSVSSRVSASVSPAMLLTG